MRRVIDDIAIKSNVDKWLNFARENGQIPTGRHVVDILPECEDRWHWRYGVNCILPVLLKSVTKSHLNFDILLVFTFPFNRSQFLEMLKDKTTPLFHGSTSPYFHVYDSVERLDADQLGAIVSPESLTVFDLPCNPSSLYYRDEFDPDDGTWMGWLTFAFYGKQLACGQPSRPDHLC